jgi:hemoglobin
MWFECIRCCFQMDAGQNGLELAQIAALKSLRNSPRCRGWRVLPAPGNPYVWILAIDWDPGALLTPFRASQEFEVLHAALGAQVRALEEADYRTDNHMLRRILGGPEALFRLAEDIVVGVMEEPELRARFESDDGSRRGRLGLWLLEVLGGPDLFSSSFPDAMPSEGPLSGELLDLDERATLLDIAQNALPSSAQEEGRCVLGNLRAYLPLHPAPLSQLGLNARRLEERVAAAAPTRNGMSRPEAASGDEPASHQRAIYPEVPLAEPSDEPASSWRTPHVRIRGCR